VYRDIEMANSRSNVQDEDRLAEMGYKQELRRDWSMLHNFGVSFSIIVGHTDFPYPLSSLYSSRMDAGLLNFDSGRMLPIEC